MPYFKVGPCRDNLRQKVGFSVITDQVAVANRLPILTMLAKAAFEEAFPYIESTLGQLLSAQLVKLIRTDAPILSADGRTAVPAGSLGFVLGEGKYTFDLEGCGWYDVLYNAASGLSVPLTILDRLTLTPSFYRHAVTLGSSWGSGYHATPSQSEPYSPTLGLFGIGSRVPVDSAYTSDGSQRKLELPATAATTLKVLTAMVSGGIEITNTVADLTHAWFPMLVDNTEFVSNAASLGASVGSTFRAIFGIDRRDLTSDAVQSNLRVRSTVPWAPYPHGFENAVGSSDLVEPPAMAATEDHSEPVLVPSMSVSQVTRAVATPGQLEALMKALRQRK